MLSGLGHENSSVKAGAEVPVSASLRAPSILNRASTAPGPYMSPRVYQSIQAGCHHTSLDQCFGAARQTRENLSFSHCFGSAGLSRENLTISQCVETAALIRKNLTFSHCFSSTGPSRDNLTISQCLEAAGLIRKNLTLSHCFSNHHGRAVAQQHETAPCKSSSLTEEGPFNAI